MTPRIIINRILLCFLVFQVVLLGACSLNKGSSDRDAQDLKAERSYGYIDKSGKFIIKPQFFNAQEFSEGLAAVVSGGRLFYIKIDGSRAFSKSFEIPLTMCNVLGKDGICRVIYLDQISQGCYFSEDVAPIPFKSGKDWLWGYVDKKGQTVIYSQFKCAEAFHEGMAAVIFTNDEYGFINHEGNTMMRFPFSKVIDGAPSPTRSRVYCGPFSSGLAAIWSKGKWGYIDKKGQIVINPQYDYACPFSDHVALVKIEHRKPIDPNSPISKMVHSGKFGPAYDVTQECFFINEKGQRLNDMSYDGADSFSEGLAPVKLEKKWGYSDKSGKFVIPAQFEHAWPFKNNLGRVNIKNKYGCIDKSGTWVIGPLFESLGPFSDNLAAAKR